MILSLEIGLSERPLRDWTISVLRFSLNQKKGLFRWRKLKSFGNGGTPE
jgi:hypothetical protein